MFNIKVSRFQKGNITILFVFYLSLVSIVDKITIRLMSKIIKCIFSIILIKTIYTFTEELRLKIQLSANRTIWTNCIIICLLRTQEVGLHCRGRTLDTDSKVYENWRSTEVLDNHQILHSQRRAKVAPPMGPCLARYSATA